MMKQDRQIEEIWAEVLDDILLDCVPEEVRERVLSTLLARAMERRRAPIKFIKASERAASRTSLPRR